VRTHTTCATCGGQLDVTPAMPAGHMTHYDCPPATDPLSQLRRQYLAAITGGASEKDVTELENQLDGWDRRPPHLAAAALAYAAWGWPVFPVAPGLKRPASDHGLHDATTDPATITEWWRRWPGANIGVPTGYAFDVIDIDPAGVDWWYRHGQPDGPLPDIHGTVSTPRVTGWHLYVEPTGMRNKTGLAPGVDYRGMGGYVLVPPSRLTPRAYPDDTQLPAVLAYTWTVYPSPAIKPAARTEAD